MKDTEHKEQVAWFKNKYYKYYFNIINKSNSRSEINGYYEKHHIIPISFGGDNSDNNIAVLTAREHFICHWLLTKFTSGEMRIKMLFAFSMMAKTRVGKLNIYSKAYEASRKAHSEAARILCLSSPPSRGETARLKIAASSSRRIHTDESRQKRSEKMSGSKHPNYGKKRNKEVIEKMRIASLGKNHSELSKKKISEKLSGRKLSEEHKNKIGLNSSKKLKGKAGELCKKSKKINLIVNGLIINTYFSAKEASIQNSVSIGNLCSCARGERKHAGTDKEGNKLSWSYI